MPKHKHSATEKSKNNSPIWVYGMHAVASCVQNQPENIIAACYTKQDALINALLDELTALGVPAQITEQSVLSEKLGADARHQGIAIQLKKLRSYHENDLYRLIEEKQAAQQKVLLLILDGVTDPRNLGACLRSANGAGVDAVIAPKDNAAHITAVARKTASGAAETTPFIQVSNIQRTLKSLKEKAIWIYGTSDKADSSIYDENFQQDTALVLGSEDKGLRALTAKHCDMMVSLPMWGSVSSLNVSVATGICLYEIRRQQQTT